MRTEPNRSSLSRTTSNSYPLVRSELYRELCQDEDGTRYTVIVDRPYPDLSITDYQLEDGTPVRFVDDCLFEIETTGRTLTRCP